MSINPSIQAKWGLVILAGLWIDFVWVFHLEWTLNQQYSYGWLTPFLLAYLLRARWQTRPTPASSIAHAPVLLGIGIVTLYPLRAVLWANPDWRLALWSYALIIMVLSLIVLAGMGGARWARYFSPAFLLMLFAVPWPTAIENPLVQGMMRMVATVVVETMTFLGVYAEQAGNLIRLRSGWIGVEEACSGVRSLQSTLMSAWFLGELFRFRLSGRLLLLVCGGGASFLFNIGRTFILTWITHTRGPDFMGQLHDPIGHAVSVGAFFALLLIALLLRSIFNEREQRSATNGYQFSHTSYATRGVWSANVASICILCLIGTHFVSWAWFYRQEQNLPSAVPIEVSWNRLPFEPSFAEIQPQIQAQLRYSEGTQAEWVESGSDVDWTVFHFVWEAGRVSPFMAVHRPETCLPGSGFTLDAIHPELVVQTPRRTIAFQVMTFRFEQTHLQVFFASWNDHPGMGSNGYLTTADRLKNAVRGYRVTGRRSLQIVMRGLEAPGSARLRAERFLTTVLREAVPS